MLGAGWARAWMQPVIPHHHTPNASQVHPWVSKAAAPEAVRLIEAPMDSLIVRVSPHRPSPWLARRTGPSLEIPGEVREDPQGSLQLPPSIPLMGNSVSERWGVVDGLVG